jgi:hypothetical protein
MRIGSTTVLPFVLPFLPSAFSQVTVYTGIPGAASASEGSDPSATVAGPGGFTTNLPAYDTTRLTGPAPIQPPLNDYSIGIPSPDLLTASRPLSKPIRGNLLGFSVELSVADQILGTTGQVLKPQFLNYLANIQQRSGVGPQVRVGGNSQEGSSIFVEGTSNGRLIEKIKVSDYPVSPTIWLLRDAYLQVDGNTHYQLQPRPFRCDAQHLERCRRRVVLWYIIQRIGRHYKLGQCPPGRPIRCGNSWHTLERSSNR